MLTLCFPSEYKKVVEIGIEIKEEYCKLHNYSLILETGPECIDRSRPLPWSKINVILKYLNKFDYVFWSDADTIIKNFKIKLEDLINLYNDNKALIVAIDGLGNPNTGNFFVRNCPQAFNMLNEIYNQQDYIFHDWWENGAFIKLLNTNSIFKFQVHLEKNSRLFNAFTFGSNPYRSGDFLIHYVGLEGWPTPVNLGIHKVYNRNTKFYPEVQDSLSTEALEYIKRRIK